MCRMAMFRRGGACLALLSFDLYLGLYLGGVTGCAAAQPQPQTSAAAAETPPESPGIQVAPECVNAEDQHVECLADTDCCSGFVCGKDPELSSRVSYCIYGG